MLPAGTPAPDFALPNQDGQVVRLSALLAAGPVIVYFYPADFTPGCTAQACSLRDVNAELRAAGYQLVGLSPQSPASHAKFRSEHRLPFDLLSDEDKAVHRLYQAVWPLGLGVRRITYLIGQDGRVLDALEANARIGRHREFVERLLRKDSAG